MERDDKILLIFMWLEYYFNCVFSVYDQMNIKLSESVFDPMGLVLIYFFLSITFCFCYFLIEHDYIKMPLEAL